MKIWEGKEWESHIQLLLKRHHGTEYQDIADEDGGDYGLEGFSLNGCVYQCYAAKEPATTADLYTRQVNKITRDINKFIKNRTDLEKVFGDLKISRWILVVPRYKSATLLKHAERKTQDVIKAKLPYTTSDFKVLIITDDYFRVEQQELTKSGISFNPLDVSTEEIEKWKKEKGNLVLISNLVNKVDKINTLSDIQKDSFVDKTIKYFIIGQDLLGKLNDLYPNAYEQIISYKSIQEDLIEFELVSDASGEEFKKFKETFFHYKKDMEKELDSLNPNSLTILSYEAVSDWLMRCPLDF